MPRIANYSTDEWVSLVLREHPEFKDLYDYSTTEYVNAKTKVNILCKKCGNIFLQLPNNHRKGGKGCPFCAGNKKKDAEYVKREGERLHGVGRYDYSEVVFVNMNTKISIKCNVCGTVFAQTPAHHLLGGKCGCPECAKVRKGEKKRMGTERFIERAKKVHEDKYDYSKVNYGKSQYDKVDIVCKKCRRTFSQSPDAHVNQKQGCPWCACGNHRSAVEESVFDFVKSICPDAEQSDRTVLDDGKELDIYVPSKRVAIEVNGIFWHGDNHKSRDYHYKKWQACKEKGIRLIQITDYDWNNNQKVFSQLLAHALGCNGDRKVNARECEVVHLKSIECKEFYNAYHPQGHSPNPINLALKTKEGEIVAIMSFGYGKTTRGQARANGTTKATWELSRFASSCPVRGGASKLFKTFIRENNPEEVSSFSMNDYFAGGVYEVLGFVAETYGKPDYRVFHPGNGLRPKPHWQRRLIPKRLEEIGRSDVNFNPDKSIDPRTEREIEDLVGAIRLWDSGKIKWVWRAK